MGHRGTARSALRRRPHRGRGGVRAFDDRAMGAGGRRSAIVPARFRGRRAPTSRHRAPRNAVLGRDPRDADFVFLGNQMDVDNVADSRCRVLASPSWCLHAYVISNEGARRALSLLRTQMEFDDRWLSAVDIEARTWMERGEIRYVCWNGTMLPKPFPVSDGPRTGVDLGPDVMRPKADTGLFFQNFSLGSAIWPQHSATSGGRRLRKPRAVLIAPTAPHREGNGLAMRAGVALEGLARTCDVALVVAPYGYGRVSSWAKEIAERILVLSDAHADPFLRRIPHVTSSERDLARLAYPRPFASTWSTPAGAAAIVELVSGRADLVYVTRSYLAPLAEPWLAGDHRPPVVLDVDEDDAQALRQLADVWRLDEDDLVAAQLMTADADKLELIANQWIPRADLVLASSDVEVAALRTRFADLPARVLPNPVPMRGNEGWAEPVDVAFVANFDYRPNQDAARWLCRQVFPPAAAYGAGGPGRAGRKPHRSGRRRARWRWGHTRPGPLVGHADLRSDHHRRGSVARRWRDQDQDLGGIRSPADGGQYLTRGGGSPGHLGQAPPDSR